ncbi:S-layer homology domain-containing protein [Paenibacillus sp. FSL R10-2199]|uniref:S-layer homology domain-containing protein n=1 Tax=Paenibacillus sp. FSL R10-2199 TaxID=2975348 RepID=UPI0030FAC54E
MKKKLAVSTLAVSMAAASVAGLPLSSILGQSGIVGTASAASANYETLKARANLLYGKLSDASKQTLREFRAELQSVSRTELETALAPILDHVTLSSTEKTTLFDFYLEVVGSYYNPDVTAITDILESPNYPAYQALVKNIGEQAGITDLTVGKVYNFISVVEQKEIAAFKGANLADLYAAAKNPSSALAVQAKNIALNTNVVAGTDYTLKAALLELGVDANLVSTLKTNLEAIPSVTKAKDAAVILAAAYYDVYLKSGAVVDPGTGSGGGGGGGSSTVTTPVTNPTATPGIYDVSKLVTIVGDKATLKLVDADVLKAFDALVASSTVKTGLTLTLNLGTVNAATVEVPLSKAIIEAAKAKGIANIAITFNGLTVTIPVGQFSEAITLTASTIADSTVTSISSLKLASSVYEFDLTVGGVATTTFQQPIIIKLPLKNATGLDKELLSVTKIVYSALQFQGGTVDGDYIIEPRDTFSSYAVVENKVSFKDIASVQAWAGRQIAVVAAKGAIEGVGNGNFAPKSNVTRAEFAKMLIRALNLENNSAKQSFSDVSTTSWYAPYVAVAAEKGIITGRSAAQFDPNATITRAEMATMISRAIKSVNPAANTSASALSKFSDAAKISASLRDGVAFAASNNLVIGNAGKFNPNNTATRAEAAVIIYRTINFK